MGAFLIRIVYRFLDWFKALLDVFGKCVKQLYSSGKCMRSYGVIQQVLLPLAPAVSQRYQILYFGKNA